MRVHIDQTGHNDLSRSIVNLCAVSGKICANSANHTVRNEVIGYTAQNSVVITVRNLNNVGKIIDAALANGANRIDSLNFTASDTSAAKNEALTDAVRSAKEKAQAVASALGVRLVRIANVYADTQADMPRYENYMPMMMAKGASAAATPIAPGELSVAATANVTYVIE